MNEQLNNELEIIVNNWNNKYPIGTRIVFIDSKLESKTRSTALVKYDEAIIYVEGNDVAQSLDSIKPKRRKINSNK